MPSTQQFAHKVVHVTISGTMLGGGEIWQTGFHVGRLTSDADTPTQAYVDAVRNAWSPMWSSNTGPYCYLYNFTGVKAVLLEVDGKYGSNEPVESFPTAQVAGGYPGSAMPPQVALVATLVGGSGKGTGGKGRMYLPGVSWPIDTTGHIVTGNAQRVATDLAAFFNTIDAVAGAPGHVVNASKGHKVTGDTGPIWINPRNVPVNGVRVGNVYDTQRRRRNALHETYSVATVAD